MPALVASVAFLQQFWVVIGLVLVFGLHNHIKKNIQLQKSRVSHVTPLHGRPKQHAARANACPAVFDSNCKGRGPPPCSYNPAAVKLVVADFPYCSDRAGCSWRYPLSTVALSPCLGPCLLCLAPCLCLSPCPVLCRGHVVHHCDRGLRLYRRKDT